MIFDPLKMESTTFLESVAQTKGYSAGHKKGTKVAHKLTYPFIRSAASMFSNINDLSQFANCFMNDGVIDNRQVISKNVINEMATAYTPIGVLHQYLGYPDSKYNYGLIGFTYRGIQFLGHPGESGSQNILFVMAPEHKAIFILMSNTGSYPFIQSFEKMVETFLPVQPYVTTHEPLIDINKYTGKYYRPNIKNNKYDALYIRARGKKLYIDFGEEDTYLLSQSGEHRFTYNSPNIKWAMEIKFYTNIKGQVEYVNNAWRTFVKIK